MYCPKYVMIGSSQFILPPNIYHELLQGPTKALSLMVFDYVNILLRSYHPIINSYFSHHQHSQQITTSEILVLASTIQLIKLGLLIVSKHYQNNYSTQQEVTRQQRCEPYVITNLALTLAKTLSINEHRALLNRCKALRKMIPISSLHRCSIANNKINKSASINAGQVKKYISRKCKQILDELAMLSTFD